MKLVRTRISDHVTEAGVAANFFRALGPEAIIIVLKPINYECKNCTITDTSSYVVMNYSKFSEIRLDIHL